MEFPFLWRLFQIRSIFFKNVVLLQGTYYDLYQHNHPSQAVEVTEAIMEEFSREARKRGKRSLILIIPIHIDLAFHRRHGK